MEEYRRQTAEGKGNFALAYIFLDRGSLVVTSWPIARRQLLELEKILVTYISLLIEFKWETEFINSSTKPMATDTIKFKLTLRPNVTLCNVEKK